MAITTSQRRFLVAGQWDSFARAVLPRECHPVQRQEMRRAFYAGAMALFDGIIQSFSAGDEVTQADVALLESVQKELDEFTNQVRAGRA